MKPDRSPKSLPICLPNDVTHDGINWEPSWAERQWLKFFRQKAEFESQWMADALKRVAAVAAVIDKDRREMKLRDEQEKIDKWRRAEAEENEKLRQIYELRQTK